MRFDATSRLRRFLAAETGAITPMALFFTVLFIAAGGLAVDIAQHVAARTHLQIATDSAAHAALVSRRRHSEAGARRIALDLLEDNMPARRFGVAVEPHDIVFGRWTSNGFEPDPGSRAAVRVVARRTEARQNPMRTFMLRVIGIDSLDIVTASAFTTHQPICIDEGFVAEGRVDVQSNNNYLRGFCIHSNDYVRINQNNYFEEGTIVSMPDLDLLQIPNSGFERNEGLEMALREGWVDIRILRELDDVIHGVLNNHGEYARSYISNPSPIVRNFSQNNNQVRANDLVSGRIHDISCVGQNQRISIPNGEVLSDVVIVTNCQVDLGGSVQLDNVVIASTNTTDTAISGASGVNIGRDDNCAPGGGAQIVTLGSMRFPANLGIFGSQLIAQGDVEFAARSDGVQGASIIAGGVIDGTSNSTMARCNRGMEDNFRSPYYRMAQ